MLTIERYKMILELLKLKSNVSIQELLETLNVSEATIRRDLNTLEKQKKVKRVHGGAIYIDNKDFSTNQDFDISSRKLLAKEEKEKIAKKAAALIKNDSNIYLDAGTTTFQVIKYLKNKNIKVVTNGLNLISELEKYNIETYLIGGKIKTKTSCIVGNLAVESIKKYRFDYVFLGSNGFSLDGYTTPDPEEAALKNAALSLSDNIFFLCDNTKLNKNSFVIFGKLEDGILITDKEVPKEYHEKTKIEVV